MFTPLTINKTTAIIHLTKGRHTIIDVEDWERVSKYKWFYSKGGFAARSQWLSKQRPKKRPVILSRFIMGVDGQPRSVQVDHINGKKLENRKSNLRVCSQMQNLRNQRKYKGESLYKGVKFERRTKIPTFVARIVANYQEIHLGTFTSEEAAARAYDVAAVKYHGEFARLNFPADKG